MIPDRWSVLIQKGEVNPRYYNPGDLFDEVHIMMTNDDRPDPEFMKPMVGKAKLFLYNYPEPSGFFKKTLGWRPWRMKSWSKGAVDIARKIQPNLMRCHGLYLNTFLAAEIKSALKIPYLVSIHINPDENFRKHLKTLKEKIVNTCIKEVENYSLKYADLVMPVYEPIVPYLKKRGILHYQVCYNVVGESFLQKKDNYTYSSPFKLICIGNLHHQKNPINLIKAVEKMPDVTLTIVGNGDLQEDLVQYVSDKNLNPRIKFYKGIPNKDLRSFITSHDAVTLQTEHFEFSKVMIESSLSGMPILTNYLKSRLRVPELQYDNCLFVENTVLGYEQGIEKLMTDDSLRKKLGENARNLASERCNPHVCEKKYADIYKAHMK